MKPDSNDPLDRLLQEWTVQSEPPPSFRREVWQRIASDGGKSSWAERLAWWLLRPKREAFVLALVVTAAVIWGLTHPEGQSINPHDAYVMSISPFDPHHLDGNYP